MLSPPGRSAEARQQIEQWLASRGLELNAHKTRTVNLTQESIRFLGFGVKVRRSRKGRAYAHVEPTGASCQALREKVRDILSHHTQWRAIAEVVREVNTSVRGWSGYFHYGNSAGVFARMHYWLSNRLRPPQAGCGASTAAVEDSTNTTPSNNSKSAMDSGPCRAMRLGALHESQRPNERMELGKPCAGKPPARFDEGSETKAAASFKLPRTRLSPTLLASLHASPKSDAKVTE